MRLLKWTKQTIRISEEDINLHEKCILTSNTISLKTTAIDRTFSNKMKKKKYLGYFALS